MIPSKRPMSRTGSSRLLMLLILSFPKIRETLFLKLLELRCQTFESLDVITPAPMEFVEAALHEIDEELCRDDLEET